MTALFAPQACVPLASDPVVNSALRHLYLGPPATALDVLRDDFSFDSATLPCAPSSIPQALKNGYVDVWSEVDIRR